jgi:hypothetical protein
MYLLTMARTEHNIKEISTILQLAIKIYCTDSDIINDYELSDSRSSTSHGKTGLTLVSSNRQRVINFDPEVIKDYMVSLTL